MSQAYVIVNAIVVLAINMLKICESKKNTQENISSLKKTSSAFKAHCRKYKDVLVVRLLDKYNHCFMRLSLKHDKNKLAREDIVINSFSLCYDGCPKHNNNYYILQDDMWLLIFEDLSEIMGISSFTTIQTYTTDDHMIIKFNMPILLDNLAVNFIDGTINKVIEKEGGISVADRRAKKRACRKWINDSIKNGKA